MPTDDVEAAAATEGMKTIRTPRLELVLMSVPFMEALAAGDLAGAEREIGAQVPRDMPDDLRHFLGYRLAQLATSPGDRRWLGRAIVLSDEHGRRRVIGSAGFHGPPDEAGRLEVGYRIEPAFRRKGLARETVRALFDWAAREHGIHRFIASIAPTNVASLGLARQLGFRRVGSQIDEIDGLELIFETDWPPPSER